MSRTALAIGASLACVLAFATVAQAAPIPRQSVIQSVACPTMQIVGLRGSGEAAAGYGTTVGAVVGAVEAVNMTATAVAIDYPAVPTQRWLPADFTGNYTKSVHAGIVQTTHWITDFLAGPCGETTFLYLVGYDQGADVVGDVYQSALTYSQRARVAGVALLSDPRFNGRQGAPVNLGTYNTRNNGIEVQTGTARRVVVAQEPFVRSFCLDSDPVCNFTQRDQIQCQISQLLCPAADYVHTHAPLANTSYTSLAAAYLLSQWRTVGPPPNVPHRNVLIFGDGDVQDSATGVTNLSRAITAAGFNVTYSINLPDDLSHYGQVWFYGQDATLITAAESQLVDYTASGRGLFLSGDWSGCCADLQQAIADVFNQLVTTDGGLQFGSNQIQDHEPVNLHAIDDVATTPNALRTFTGSFVGSISHSNVDSRHFLFTDYDDNGTVALWDGNDVRGGGRIAIVMDLNWVQTEYEDLRSMPRIAGNLTYFLSGATAPS